MDVKKNIRKIREALEYSQEYVAAKLGITQQAYSDIESGNTKITAEFLLRLAPILHVSVEQFYGVEAKPEPEPAPNGKEMLYAEKLIEVQTKLIETNDKVIALQETILAKGNGKKKQKRA